MSAEKCSYSDGSADTIDENGTSSPLPTPTSSLNFFHTMDLIHASQQLAKSEANHAAQTGNRSPKIRVSSDGELQSICGRERKPIKAYEQINSPSNWSETPLYTPSDSKSFNYVREMTKQFERITEPHMHAHQANFKQCNWWLKTPSLIPYFDDFATDTSPLPSPAFEKQYRPSDIYEKHQRNTNERLTADDKAVDGDGGGGGGGDVDSDENEGASNKHIQTKSHHDHSPDKADLFNKIELTLRSQINSINNFANNGSNKRFTPSSERLDVSSVSLVDNVRIMSKIMHEDNTTTEGESLRHSLLSDDVTNDGTANSSIRPISISSTISQISSSSTMSSTSTASVTSFNSTSSVASTQVTNTLEELLSNEETYIRSLNQGINGYMNNFNQKPMPNALRGQKYRVFGNVHRIKDFHENVFYPELLSCNMDIVKICQTFCDYIEKDCFYIYILYAINRQKSDKICEEHREYFKQIQNNIGDKLGINSFLVQPIQRLPKYKLLLGQLITELGKRLHDDNVKAEIAACCTAEKRLQRLLDTVNGSMNINDIVDCYDVHVFCQGKFKKIGEFDIWENESKRRYKGKVFLFEKCIIYTEISSKNRLLYRGHFRQATLGFTFEDGKNNFKLYNGKRGKQEIEFSSDAQTLQMWIQLLNLTMAVVVLNEKKKIQDHRKNSSKSDVGPLSILLRINSPSVGQLSLATASVNSDSSVFTTDSTACSLDIRRTETIDGSSRDSSSTKSSRNSDPTNQTTWYTELEDEHKIIERFLNSEKYYIHLLNQAIKNYLTNLPEPIQVTLSSYLIAVKSIAKFHAETLYPKLHNCEMKATAICDLIKSSIEAMDFNIYYLYAAFANQAVELVEGFLMNNENTKQEDNDELAADVEHSLLLPLQHIENYSKFLETLLNDYKEKNFLNEEFKVIASVEISVKKLHKLVMENYRLNSIKGSKFLGRKFGLVIYSDEISIDAAKFRLLILEKGLACVKIRMSAKTKKEKFLEQHFYIPLAAVEVHENDLYPRKLKISAQNSSHVNYTICFAATRKKKQFIEMIRAQRNEPQKLIASLND